MFAAVKHFIAKRKSARALKRLRAQLREGHTMPKDMVFDILKEKEELIALNERSQNALRASYYKGQVDAFRAILAYKEEYERDS